MPSRPLPAPHHPSPCHSQSASMWFRVRLVAPPTPTPNFSCLPLKDFPEFMRKKRSKEKEMRLLPADARTYSREAGSARCCDVGSDPGAAVLLPTVWDACDSRATSRLGWSASVSLLVRRSPPFTLQSLSRLQAHFSARTRPSPMGATLQKGGGQGGRRERTQKK